MHQTVKLQFTSKTLLGSTCLIDLLYNFILYISLAWFLPSGALHFDLVLYSIICIYIVKCWEGYQNNQSVRPTYCLLSEREEYWYGNYKLCSASCIVDAAVAVQTPKSGFTLPTVLY